MDDPINIRQTREFQAALLELNALTASIVGSEGMHELQMIDAIELPRRHDLQPRRWQMPDGSIVAQAINREAFELLKNDPEEYFRRTALHR